MPETQYRITGGYRTGSERPKSEYRHAEDEHESARLGRPRTKVIITVISPPRTAQDGRRSARVAIGATALCALYPGMAPTASRLGFWRRLTGADRRE
jgi:hypothetical protein